MVVDGGSDGAVQQPHLCQSPPDLFCLFDSISSFPDIIYLCTLGPRFIDWPIPLPNTFNYQCFQMQNKLTKRHDYKHILNTLHQIVGVNVELIGSSNRLVRFKY